jgi:hypothetical protein
VPAQQGEEVANDSPFAEGFMDAAAQFWLDDRLHELCSFGAAVQQEKADFYKAVTPLGTAESAARLFGREAAENLVGALSTGGSSSIWARHAVAKLAIAMNSAPIELDRKDNFVARLNASWRTVPPELRLVLEGSAPVESVL